MATHQHATLEDTVYTWFGSNDTGGDGDDGASPVWSVRLAGAASSAAAVDTGTPTLLTHVDFTAGAHEVAVAATAVNGFAAGNTYAVFVSLLVSAVNPTGFAGSFTLGPIIADLQEMGGVAQSAADLKDFADAGYDPGTNKVQGVVLVDTVTTNTDKNTLAATDIVTNGAIATTTGSVDNVTLVDTTTTNTDKNTLAATDIVSAGAITTSAGKVSGVILADTVTTYTGNTPQTADNDTKLTTIAADVVNIDGIVPEAAGVAAIKTKQDTMETTLNAAAVEATLAAVKVVTDNLAASATTIVPGTVAATAGSTTIIYSDDITEATADHYNGRIIIFTSGAMQNQATDITDYVLEGGEGKFTVTATTETAAEDVTFVIV